MENSAKRLIVLESGELENATSSVNNQKSVDVDEILRELAESRSEPGR